MLHICHIISGDLWAGAEIMALELIRELHSDASISITAIVLTEGMLSRSFRESGVETYVLSEKEMSFYQIYLRIRAIIKNGNFNVIHSHRYKENFLAFLASLWLNSPRLISTLHGMPEHMSSSKANIVQRLNLFFLARRFEATVAVSRDIHDTLIEQFGFNKENVPIIHNGISLPLPINERKNNSKCIIGSAGRFVPIKNYPMMIEIARRCGAASKVNFELAGSGPELSKLQALIHSYGLESTFELCGHQDSMSAFYQRLDIFVNTSLHEGIPMSILEAMSYGIPVVAPQAGGIPEIIEDGIDGFLIPPGNVDLFTEKCLLLSKDLELRKKLGSSARHKIETKFSIRACAEKYKMIYSNK
jgi:L-malate glycosyltransferase